MSSRNPVLTKTMKWPYGYVKPFAWRGSVEINLQSRAFPKPTALNNTLDHKPMQSQAFREEPSSKSPCKHFPIILQPFWFHFDSSFRESWPPNRKTIETQYSWPISPPTFSSNMYNTGYDVTLGYVITHIMYYTMHGGNPRAPPRGVGPGRPPTYHIMWRGCGEGA